MFVLASVGTITCRQLVIYATDLKKTWEWPVKTYNYKFNSSLYNTQTGGVDILTWHGHCTTIGSHRRAPNSALNLVKEAENNYVCGALDTVESRAHKKNACGPASSVYLCALDTVECILHSINTVSQLRERVTSDHRSLIPSQKKCVGQQYSRHVRRH